MGTHVVNARVRRTRAPRALVGLVALASAACEGPVSRIISVSPGQATEHRATVLVLNTSGCAPGFDIDRTSQIAVSATLHLSGAASLSYPATRHGSDLFAVALDEQVAPGAYSLDLTLDDGRHALYDANFTVSPVDPVITAVTSPVAVISFGQSGLPLHVAVDNPSGCAIDGLRIVPTFTQNGTALSFRVTGSPVHVDPQSSAGVDLSVDVSSDAQAGAIRVNATGTGGTRSGSQGCSGAVSAVSQAADSVWVLVPAQHQSLTITALTVMNRNVQVGQSFPIQVDVRNDATVPLVPDHAEVQSTPAGIISGNMPGLPARTLQPGATDSYTVSATTTPDVVRQTTCVVSVAMTAHDGSGTLYSSPTDGPTTTVTVHGM
jgi:hypothetical protein